jgi:hypothetical protein
MNSKLFKQNEKHTMEMTDQVSNKLTKREIISLISILEDFKNFRVGKMNLDKLDEILLFTPNKVKEGAYKIEEVMYGGEIRSIRDLIEVSNKPLYNF